MNEIVVKEKNDLTDIPKDGEQFDEKSDESVNASPGAETETEVTKKLNKKEAEMADKKDNKVEDLVEDLESVLGKSAVAEDIKAAEKNKQNTDGEKKAPAKEEDNKLPPDVTVEPQDPEHMDLSLIEHSPSLVKAYLQVSDNDYGIHGSKKIEMEVKKFCDEYNKIDWENEKNPGKLLNKLRDLTVLYTITLNVADSTMSGIACKSHIRQGILFEIQKKGVKSIGLKWEDWFEENYKARHLRSAVDYMSVAEIPNAIRYAVFGITRLKKLKKVIQITAEDPDPIYTFLNEHRLVFDPECDDPIDDFNKEVDAAIAESTIKKIEKKNTISYGITEGLIKKMVLQGIPVSKDVIRNIHLIHESKGDVNDYLKKRYINNGKEFDVIENENKTKGFRKMVADIKSAVEIFRSDLTKLNANVDDDQIDTLEKALIELKRLKNL